MAEVEFASGAAPQPGWRFCEYHYGTIHGWLEEASNRSAFVLAGPDSFERAKALLAGTTTPHRVEQGGLMLLDAAATDAQTLARRDAEER